MSERTIYAMRGERWDQVCFRAYGSADENAMMELRAANRELANNMVSFTFAGGELLTVPSINAAAINETTERPPWAS